MPPSCSPALPNVSAARSSPIPGKDGRSRTQSCLFLVVHVWRCATHHQKHLCVLKHSALSEAHLNGPFVLAGPTEMHRDRPNIGRTRSSDVTIVLESVHVLLLPAWTEHSSS